MREFGDWIDRNILPLLAVALAVLGGAVRGSRDTKSERFSWRRFAWSLGAAAFVGVICSLLLSSSTLSPKIQMAIAGMSGYGAREILDCLPEAAKRRLGMGG